MSSGVGPVECQIWTQCAEEVVGNSSQYRRWTGAKLDARTIANEPADSPQIVTLLGSPPNAEIFSEIHANAFRMSRRDRFVLPDPLILVNFVTVEKQCCFYMPGF